INLVCRVHRSSGGRVAQWLWRKRAKYSGLPWWSRWVSWDLPLPRAQSYSRSFTMNAVVNKPGRVKDVEAVVKHCAFGVLEIIDPYALASYHRSNGDFWEAERLIDVCLDNADRSDDAWALNLRGTIARLRRRYGDAEKAFEAAAAISPGHAVVFTNWSVLL